jgi:hypothetical protein
VEREIDVLSVLLAAIASMVAGIAWYSPLLFGKPWAALKGYTSETLKTEQQKLGKFYAITFIFAILTAYLLAHVIGMSQFSDQTPAIQTGLTSAFLMWLGFVMPTQFGAQLFGEKKWKLFALDTGYQLVSLLAMGAVIGAR